MPAGNKRFSRVSPETANPHNNTKAGHSKM